MTTTYQTNLTDTTYNGWTNYETWNVALWLGNDEGLYNLARDWAEHGYKSLSHMLIEMSPETVNQCQEFVTISGTAHESQHQFTVHSLVRIVIYTRGTL